MGTDLADQRKLKVFPGWGMEDGESVCVGKGVCLSDRTPEELSYYYHQELLKARVQMGRERGNWQKVCIRRSSLWTSVQPDKVSGHQVQLVSLKVRDKFKFT